MDKNWLIRTKSNHILGPVSKDKVLELYHNGSIKADDEVCSGNGYWFFIREEEMVARFLTGSETQAFNPISEAKDVLTSRSESSEGSHEPDDITLVGGINLSALKTSEPVTREAPVSHETPPIPEEVPQVSTPSATEKAPTENKKKTKITPRLKSSGGTRVMKPVKKQNWIRYIGILGFIILFLMIYFRKSIINEIFSGEITSTFSIVSSAHAQEEVPPKKKRLLESSVTLDKIVFSPVIGLDGLKVETAFEIDEVTCDELNNDLYQLAVILYPADKINEKFLIKLRDCVVKLPESHPVKRWMKSLASVHPLTKEEQKAQTFLTEIINSQFNLITDQKMKTEIINILKNVPENTLPEQILKSYLYLVIGNIARSDNILKGIIGSPPRSNWEKSTKGGSIYHRIGKSEAALIFQKISRHPADRKIFQLLALYIQSFYNEPSLLAIADEVDVSDVEGKLQLRIIESMSPSFIHYLRLSNATESQRMKLLRSGSFPMDEQSYWHWPFMNIDPLVSAEMVPELERLEKHDQLWFIYILENEKIADLVSKKGGSFLPGKRPFLKEGLNDKRTFMMSLYKLIELGDINHDLVLKTTDYLIHE